MHYIQTHKVICALISFLHRIGFWHYEGNSAKEFIIKLIYCFYYALFVFSLGVGAMSSETKDEAMFTAEVAIKVIVLTFRFFVLSWKQKKILIMINQIAAFPIRYQESLTFCNEKLDKFMKFAVIYLFSVFMACSFAAVVVPFLGNERYIIFKIAFPLDWKHNDFAFLIANLFVATETYLTILPIVLSVILWYLMLSYSLRYEVLADELRNMGRLVGQEEASNISDKEKYRTFLRDLKMSIASHKLLRGLIDGFGSFSANVFFLQFCISGICICGATYCMAIDISQSFVERLVHIYSFAYNISELFMITYLGNDIKLSSYRLSYSLFESRWIDQPLSTNKLVITFGECLQQSHQLLIGKMYPLTLETFNKILNSAYSMYNILNK